MRRRPPAPARLRVLGSVVAAVLVAALLAGGSLVATAGPAAAHTELRSATPSAGQVLSGVSQVELVFTEAVQGPLSTVVVTGPDGEDRAAGPPTTDGPRVVQAVDAPLPAGAWTVAYRVIAADGHPITGTVAFTVTEPASPEPASPEPSDPEPAVTAPAESAEPAAAPAPAGADPTSEPSAVPAAATAPTSSGPSAALVAGALGAVLLAGLAGRTALRRRG